MKRHTLIHSGVAVDNLHRYNVVIGTDLGQFSGTVTCREEDYDHESKFFGFELAELKAEIEYARAKKKKYLTELKALRIFGRDMAQTRTYDANAFWVKQLHSRTAELEGKVKDWTQHVKWLQAAYYARILERDALNKKREARGL